VLKKIILYILAFIVVFILWMEILLRVKGTFHTYSEKTEGKYYTYYNKKTLRTYHVWMPHQKIDHHRSEFDYSYTANSLGLREVEFSVEKPDSLCRLLFLGDSFTEGVGTPYDSTYPRFFGNLLKESYNNIQTINAGISGSDPFLLLQTF